MSKFGRILLGSSLLIAFFLTALFFFLRSQVTKSFAVTEGTLTLPGLQHPVDVYRDESGIPHISAQNEHDLMMATGFVHAQDRLWQMDVGRRAGMGRLSEVLKTPTVPFDRLFRTLNLVETADSIERYLHPNSRRLLQDYAEGINAYITLQRGRYPIECDMLNYDPEPWTVRHSILLARLMAWELSFAWWVDLTYQDISTIVPPEKFKQILLSRSDTVRPVMAAGAARDFRDMTRSFREYFSLGPFAAGSNAWVVDSSRAAGGRPMLANDPHLRISVPGKWYEVHLNAPGWNVYGYSIPGIPFVVIGHNDSLAWGMTNAMLDDADMYIERQDTAKPGNYIFKGTSIPFQEREEVIHVGTDDSVVINIRSTVHGPVINDVHPRAMDASPDTAASRRSVLTLRWTGFEVSDEFVGFYRMNRSTNAKEFEEGLKSLSAPTQCVVYADVAGNIGSWMAGRVPVRAGGNPTLPLDGARGEAEWTGGVPFEKLPHVWNPAGGSIVSANQRVVEENSAPYLSTLWEPSYRALRINDLLAPTGKVGVDDFKRIQQDIVSYHCRELTPYVLGAFAGDSTIQDPAKRALEYLRNWDFHCSQEDIATSIFNVFFVRLLHNTFEDEMGKDLFDDFLFFSAVPYRAMSHIIPMDSSAWFDNVLSGRVESRDDIIRTSFLEALNELAGKFGTEMKTWRWGSLHTVLFAHPFGERKPLDRIFNVGPFPIGGSATTINKADYRLGDPFGFFSGPSMRQIVDMADPQRAYMITPLGQSGQPMQTHYDDQTTLWLKGGYRTTTLNMEDVRRSSVQRLSLVP